MIESLAISVAGPFGKTIKIAGKRITCYKGTYHDDMIAIDLPNHIIAGLKAEGKPHCTRHRGLRFSCDSTKDYRNLVRNFLAKCLLLHSHRHQDIQRRRLVIFTDKRWCAGVGEVEFHDIAFNLAQDIHQVTRVKSDFEAVA